MLEEEQSKYYSMDDDFKNDMEWSDTKDEM